MKQLFDTFSVQLLLYRITGDSNVIKKFANIKVPSKRLKKSQWIYRSDFQHSKEINTNRSHLSKSHLLGVSVLRFLTGLPKCRTSINETFRFTSSTNRPRLTVTTTDRLRTSFLSVYNPVHRARSPWQRCRNHSALRSSPREHLYLRDT